MTRFSLCLVGALVALGLVATDPLAAQRLDSLVSGARVRVTRQAPARSVVGTVLHADSVELVVAPKRGGSTLTMRISEVQRVEVSLGSRPRAAAFRHGAGVGFLVGAGVGAVATSLAIRSDRRSKCDCMISGTAVVGVLSVAFTGVTTLLGGALGVAGRERWHKTWPPS